MGRVRPSKNKKDATTMPPSKEMRKTQKVNKGPSALDIVKKKYKGQIMKMEELDLTKVAEAFGGYIIEAKKRKGRTSLYGNIPPEERGDGSNEKANQAKADKAMSDASKSGKIDDFTSTTIKGAPNTKTLQRDAETGKAIANPVETSKQTAEKKARVSTAGTGGKKIKNQNKFSTETGFEDAIKGKTKVPVTTTKTKVKTKGSNANILACVGSAGAGFNFCCNHIVRPIIIGSIPMFIIDKIGGTSQGTKPNKIKIPSGSGADKSCIQP